MNLIILVLNGIFIQLYLQLSKLNAFLYILSSLLLLLNIENVSNNIFLRLLPISLLSLSIFLNWIKPKYSISLSILLFVVLLVGLWSSNLPNLFGIAKMYNVLKYILYALNTKAILEKYSSWSIEKKVNRLIILPFLCFFCLNILFWLLEISSSTTFEINAGNVLFLSKVGINIKRVQFLFGYGINSFAATVGAFFAWSIFSLSKKVYVKTNSLLLIVTLLILILSDSRGALLFPVFAIILFYVFNYFKIANYIQFTPIFIFLGPLVLFLSLQILVQFSFADSLMRSDNDLQTGNSRLIIWFFALDEFLNFKLWHLVGYGQYGHYGSGVSESWASLFANYSESDSSLTHPHNSLFAILFDYGYLGLLLFILFSINLLKKVYLYRKSSFYLFGFLSVFFLYAVLIGTTESFLSTYYNNVVVCFIFLSIVSQKIYIVNEK